MEDSRENTQALPGTTRHFNDSLAAEHYVG